MKPKSQSNKEPFFKVIDYQGTQWLLIKKHQTARTYQTRQSEREVFRAEAEQEAKEKWEKVFGDIYRNGFVAVPDEQQYVRQYVARYMAEVEDEWPTYSIILLANSTDKKALLEHVIWCIDEDEMNTKFSNITKDYIKEFLKHNYPKFI